MERALPAWTPLVVAAVGLLLIPIMFAIPRDSEAVDTFLEAVPFFVIAFGVVAFPFSKAGPSRVPGVVFAVVALLSPVWFPASIMLASELARDPSSVAVQLALVPDDPDAPYTVLVPAVVDENGQLAEVLSRQQHPAWKSIEQRHGIPYLRIAASGVFEHTFRLEGQHEDEFWPPTEFPQRGIRDDAPPYESFLEAGNVTMDVHVHIIGQGQYCALQWEYHATVTPDGQDTVQLGRRDGVCT